MNDKILTMLLRLLEISFTQSDCPNISLSYNEDVDCIYIYIAKILQNYEKLYSVITGDFSKYNLVDKLERLGIKDIHVISKTNLELEILYTIKPTNALKIISATDSVLIPPLIVSNGIERWIVLTPDKNKLISALSADPNTEIKRVREICFEKFANIFKNISGIEDFLDTLKSFTPFQRNALIQAYNMKYYEWPRKCSLDELASINGISKNAYLKRLRNAEKKIIRKVVENFIILDSLKGDKSRSS